MEEEEEQGGEEGVEELYIVHSTEMKGLKYVYLHCLPFESKYIELFEILVELVLLLMIQFSLV